MVDKVPGLQIGGTVAGGGETTKSAASTASAEESTSASTVGSRTSPVPAGFAMNVPSMIATAGSGVVAAKKAVTGSDNIPKPILGTITDGRSSGEAGDSHRNGAAVATSSSNGRSLADQSPKQHGPFEPFPGASNDSPRSSIPNVLHEAPSFSSEPARRSTSPREADGTTTNSNAIGGGKNKRHHRASSDDIPRTIQAPFSHLQQPTQQQTQQQQPLPLHQFPPQFAPYTFGAYPPPPPPPPPSHYYGSGSGMSSSAHSLPNSMLHSGTGSFFFGQQHANHPPPPSLSLAAPPAFSQGPISRPPPPSRPRTYSDGGGGGGGVSSLPSSSYGGIAGSGPAGPPPRPSMLQSAQSFHECRPLLVRHHHSERGLGGGGLTTSPRAPSPRTMRQGYPQQPQSVGAATSGGSGGLGGGHQRMGGHHPNQRYPQQQRQHQKPRRGHRKSHSSSEIYPNHHQGYGSFWNIEEGDDGEEESPMLSLRSSQQASSPSLLRQSKSFDRRGELLSLTGGLPGMGRSPRMGGGGSPSASGGSAGRKAYGGTSGGGSGYVVGNSIGSHSSVGSQHQRGIPAHYVVQNSVGSQASVGSQRGGAHPRVAWSPVVNFATAGDPTAVSSLGGSGGGAEAFLLSQQTKRYKSESVRRKHMRQHSAQLYMEEVKGVEQPRKCRDVVFLLLFAFHLLGIVYAGNMYASEAFKTHSELEQKKHSTVTVYYNSLLYLSCISGAFSVVLSSLLLAAMSIFPKNFVQVALVVVITLSFVWGTIGIGLSPKNIVPITGIIALAFSVAYAFIVWDRIPFAATNLASALSAIRSHSGIVLLAVCVQMMTLLWCIYFCIVVVGVYDSIRLEKLSVSHQASVAIYLLLGASFYWTYQVLSNTIQTVTAGVIGNWWYKQGTEGAVRASACRAIFYSMGSICYGSLFLGPVRVIRQFAVLFRPTVADEASLLCLHECLYCIQSCISSLVDAIVRRFNCFAFIYVGLYGYGFTEAGSRATELFDKRGWTVIVSDDLVPNVLLLSSVVLGGVSGCFTQLMEHVDRLHIVSLNEPATVAFVVGVVNGLVLTSVLFSVISSSVNAVLVLFASSPVDFDRNHPELSDDMRNAWREVWPGALDVVDLRIALASPGGPNRRHQDAAEGLSALFVPPDPVNV